MSCRRRKNAVCQVKSGAKKRLPEKIPQGAGAFRRGRRGCGKTNAPNREGRSLSCRRRKNAACQVKSAGKKRLLEKIPQGAGAFRRGCRGCGKRMRPKRRAPEAFLLTEKNRFAGVERFRVGTTPPCVFDYGQITLTAKDEINADNTASRLRL